MIFANFTPQLGYELKGPHLAVVLNKDDQSKNPILQVLPLSSKYHAEYLDLGSGISSVLLSKVNKRLKELVTDRFWLEEEYGQYQIDLSQLPLEVTECDGKVKQFEDNLKTIKKVLKKIENNGKEKVSLTIFESSLKQESYAITGQISALDKRRILAFSGLRKLLKDTLIPEKEMKSINSRLYELYIDTPIV